MNVDLEADFEQCDLDLETDSVLCNLENSQADIYLDNLDNFG